MSTIEQAQFRDRIGEQLISDAQQRMWAAEREAKDVMDFYERGVMTLDEYVILIRNLLSASEELQALTKKHPSVILRR